MPSWQGEPPPGSADPGALDPGAVRAAADEILARPEYREPEPTLADRVLEWIGDLLGRAVGALTGSGAGGVVGTVVVLAVLALAAWFLFRALRAQGGRRPHVPPSGVVHGTVAPDDPAVWSAEAERAAAAGDHRSALRCRYQELVSHLVRDRVVAADPARTPAELRASLAADHPSLAADLDELTDRFEAVWYGGVPVDRAGSERFGATAARVREAARAPGARATATSSVGAS